MTKIYYTYILSSKKNGTLYIGITSDIGRRVYEHKHKLIKGFTQKYNVNKLVYYEEYNSPWAAIGREKQLKKYTRYRKICLIESENRNWRDLAENWY